MLHFSGKFFIQTVFLHFSYSRHLKSRHNISKGSFLQWAASADDYDPQYLHNRALSETARERDSESHISEIGPLPLTLHLMSAPFPQPEEQRDTPYGVSPSPNKTGWQTQEGSPTQEAPLRQQTVCNDNSFGYSDCAVNNKVRK